MHRFDVSIVIACYNEIPHLEQSVDEIRAVMDQTRYTYELIFVDDDSRDNTQDIIRKLERIHPDVKTLFHAENRGRGGTVADGIQLAEGRYVGYLDIDLEVHARYIPSLIFALQQGNEVATASRVEKLQWLKLHRYVSTRGYRWLSQKVLRHGLKDTETGFKFFDRTRILPILAQVGDQGWFWDTEIMVRARRKGLKIVEIPCLFAHRADKKSTVNLFRDSCDYLAKLYRFKRQ